MCICFLHCFLWYWSWCRDGMWHKSVRKDMDGSRQSSWDRGHAQSRQTGVTLYRSSESCVSITPHPEQSTGHIPSFLFPSQFQGLHPAELISNWDWAGWKPRAGTKPPALQELQSPGSCGYLTWQKYFQDLDALLTLMPPATCEPNPQG